MPINKIELYDNDRIVNGSGAKTDGFTDELYHFSGHLDRKRERAGARFYGVWIAAAARKGAMKVTVFYTIGDPSVYEVSEGYPLMVETEVGEENLTVVNVTFEPIGKGADVELSLLRSKRLVTLTIPQTGLEFALSATGDVTFDLNGVVSWTPQQGLVANDPLDAVLLSQPEFIESHFPYNNHPAVRFDGSGQALTYSGDIQDFVGLCQGGRTMVVIHEPSDSAEVFGVICGNMGMEAGGNLQMTPQYTVRGRGQNDAAIGKTATTHEPIQRLQISTCFFRPKTFGPEVDGFVAVTTQAGGATDTVSNNGAVAGTVATEPFIVGAQPGGGKDYTGLITDILIYDHEITFEELAQITAHAVTKYGLIPEYFTNHSSTKRGLYLTAARGVTTVEGQAAQMELLQVDISVANGQYQGEPQITTTGSGTGLVADIWVTGSGANTGGYAKIAEGGSGHAVGDVLVFISDPGVAYRVEVVKDGAVTAWSDLNTAALPFTSPKGPLLIDAAVNGRNAVRFYFEDSSIHSYKQQLTSTDPAPEFSYLTGFYKYSIAGVIRSQNAEASFLSSHRDGGGNAGLRLKCLDSAGALHGLQSNTTNNPVVDTTGPPVALGTNIAFVYRWDPTGSGAAALHSHDDVSIEGGLNAPAVASAEKLTLGNDPGYLETYLPYHGFPFDGDIMEVQIVRDELWTNDMVEEFFKFAKSKYGTL